MGNTMTGTAQAETLDATVRALWDVIDTIGEDMSKSWRDEIIWQVGRLAGALTLADGSRAYGVAGIALDEGLLGAWIRDARQCVERVKQAPHGVPWFD